MTSVTLGSGASAQEAPDREAAAYLLDAGEIAWDPPEWATSGRFVLKASRLQDPAQMEEIELEEVAAGAKGALPEELGFLSGRRRFRWKAGGAEDLASLLKGRLAVEVSRDGRTASTGLQTFPAIDRHLAYGGDDLGVTFVTGSRAPRFRLWAPTARSVRLVIFRDGKEVTHAMEPAERGTWTAAGPAEWYAAAYLYEVEGYTRLSARVETRRVTDPYSVSVTTNGARSLVLDLRDPEFFPDGWEDVRPVTTEDPVDMAVYELHVRDYSASDPSVPTTIRGTYAAFDLAGSRGANHLRELAMAGMTHVHLLPCFDFATVDEDRSRWKHASIPANLPGDSELPQQEIARVQREDGHNWGYDPAHWGVPEGSYASDAEGPARVREFRQMVRGLHELGLGVVMDVVYNHTHTAGLAERSNLDPIVPGYYYRLDARGGHQSTSCCPDTATEHRMMEKLMIDTVLRWAVHYKVSGFRFDLMGHHTRDNMVKLRQALDRLTVEEHGVDGKRIWFYGEGWRFGSLDAILPGKAMHQVNAAGSGVGTFNDRLRDCLRGGDFTMETRTDQGVATGLAGDWNGAAGRLVPPGTDARAGFLRCEMDAVRLGMAGNLADFPLPEAGGRVRLGRDVIYRTQPGAGYAKDPRETVTYVAAHDNGTLFDHLVAKAPRGVAGREPASATREDLVRMQGLALGVVALSQGMPFFHAGDEILRSKSGDWDSYDSGDWFNRLDFTLMSNNWGVGLPPAEKNQAHWPFWKERLADPAWRMRLDDMRATFARFLEMLRIRQSSPLLRLRTGEAVIARMKFVDATAPEGLIAFTIEDREAPFLDGDRSALMVLVNAHRDPVDFTHAALERPWRKHAEQADSVDPVLRAVGAPAGGTIQVPGRTIVVLEEPRSKR